MTTIVYVTGYARSREVIGTATDITGDRMDMTSWEIARETMINLVKDRATNGADSIAIAIDTLWGERVTYYWSTESNLHPDSHITVGNFVCFHTHVI